MSIERTFGIVKPDAVAKNAIGGVIEMVEKTGLKIVGLRLVQLSEAQARAFYAVHKERPFFNGLVQFMTSGPAVVMAIEGENAVARYRDHPTEVRDRHREERGPWQRWARHRAWRARLLLRRARPRLSSRSVLQGGSGDGARTAYDLVRSVHKAVFILTSIRDIVDAQYNDFGAVG